MEQLFTAPKRNLYRAVILRLGKQKRWAPFHYLFLKAVFNMLPRDLENRASISHGWGNKNTQKRSNLMTSYKRREPQNGSECRLERLHSVTEGEVQPEWRHIVDNTIQWRSQKGQVLGIGIMSVWRCHALRVKKKPKQTNHNKACN